MPSALVTGSSRGIGFETCLALARAGHTVFATMRSPERAPGLARTAEEEGLPIHVSAMDVDSDESVREGVERILDAHGPVDTLVNNAGSAPHGTFEEMDLSEIRGVMETNYFGAVRCIQSVMPSMRSRGSGCIVNVSSVSGRIWSSPLGPYAASKAALEAMSEVLAQEGMQFGIRVAIVEPGIIDTAMARAVADTAESLYPQPARLSNMFAASLQAPVAPSVVAEAIVDIVEGGTRTLRHSVGPDAEPFIRWRASLTDEEWMAWWGEADDDAWYDAVEQTFGLDARPRA